MTVAEERGWVEVTYGARWDNTPSPERYQIWRMECVHCDTFNIDPVAFRHYDEFRTDHPNPYGNFASLSHARALMRQHIRVKHGAK